jgi:hypothetical protein
VCERAAAARLCLGKQVWSKSSRQGNGSSPRAVGGEPSRGPSSGEPEEGGFESKLERPEGKSEQPGLDGESMN